MKFLLTTSLSLILSFGSFFSSGLCVEVRANEPQFQTIDFLSEQKAPPCIFVVFGATGDLTARKLLPAICNLAYEGHLSEHMAVVGFARGENTHESFRSKMGEAIDQFSRIKPRNLVFWNQFKNQIFYHQSDFESDQGYEKLKELLAKIDQELGTRGNRIYYLATQPSYFPTVIAQLKKHQLIYEAENENDSWSRVIIEKPFGNDLASALRLQEQISQSLAENQTYRIDHYLGKEGVQNIFTFRFENGLFEPIWNRHHIDNIQITLAEEIGIGSRARFWEETGALRDLLQNHLMQLFAIIAMEPPTDLNPESIHREKVKVLEAVKSFPVLEIDNYAVRGQYVSGLMQGTKVRGYKEEEGVPSNSMAETFVALKLFIDNERWKDIPFYIRGGKRLAKQTTEIAITFKKSPLSQNQNPTILYMRIQPKAGIWLKTLSKVPGLHYRLQPITFGYQPDALFSTTSPEAYERLIFECMKGDDHLFVRADEQTAAWRLLTPILHHWKRQVVENLPHYEAGTWGPKAASDILLNPGHQWQLLENE